MILESAYTFLIGTGSVTSLCDSIYPEMLPVNHQNFPAIVLGVISDDDETLLDGTPSSLHTAIITVDCIDKTLATASTLADAVKSALIGYRGTFGSDSADHIRKESETPIPVDQSTGQLGISLQFFIGYT